MQSYWLFAIWVVLLSMLVNLASIADSLAILASPPRA